MPETLYLTVFIMDSYLSKRKVHSRQLHQICVAALHIAQKCEELELQNLADILVACNKKYAYA